MRPQRAPGRPQPDPRRPRFRHRGTPPRTPATPGILGPGENVRVDYARFGWLAVVFVCAITVLVLAIQGYSGYAGVTLAVALAAAINLR
jgi:hypothetical protein